MQSSKDDEILFVISGDAIKVNAWVERGGGGRHLDDLNSILKLATGSLSNLQNCMQKEILPMFN